MRGRRDLADRYFTDSAVAWASSVRAAAGAVPQPRGVDAPFAGPLCVDVLLPACDASLAIATGACAAAAATWVGWMKDAEKLPQTKTMQAFAHDAKVRKAVDFTTSTRLVRRLGTAGAEIAEYDAGPRDLTDRSTAQKCVVKLKLLSRFI